MSESQIIFTIADVLQQTEQLYSISDIKNTIELRLSTKKHNYETYDFQKSQNVALNIFFDLAQEFDNLLTTCVIATCLPSYYFNNKADLFLYSHNKKFISPHPQIKNIKLPFTDPIFTPVLKKKSFYVPVFSKRIAALPLEEAHNYFIGILAIYLEKPLDTNEDIFWEKYANRIGAQLYNQSIADKNKKHLMFIHNIIHDIDHNIISKLFYFKILLKDLEYKIQDSSRFYGKLKDIEQSHSETDFSQLTAEFAAANMDIFQTYQQAFKHFKQTSIFLESLLRKTHFDEGKYVLHATEFNFDTRILLPLLDHYQPLFAERNITVIPQLTLHNKENPALSVQMQGDYGLLAQVLDNLFSNAFKYTRPNKNGEKIIQIHTKALHNNNKEIENIHIEIRTTGQAVPPEEIKKMFNANFRCSNTENEQGTGRGLFFIREIIEAHHGRYAYTHKKDYNCFSLTLPRTLPADIV